MPGARAETLLATTYFIRRWALERAWTELTDEEFFWEPVPGGSWSIRRRSECASPTPFSNPDSDWVADFDGPLSGRENWRDVVMPPATIAWLFWHMGSMPGRVADFDFLGGTKTSGSGWASPYIAHHPMFTNAADAVETMREGWGRLVARLQEATDEDLTRPTEWHSYGEARPPAIGAQIIASTLYEVSHHAAQIGVLRDLYFHRRSP
jgi:hypothetical protein